MSKVLERIEKLLALAAGEGEEARTAAHIAARMIRENGVVLSDPSDRPHHKRAASPEPVPAGYEDMAAIYDLFGKPPPWKSDPTWVSKGAPKRDPRAAGVADPPPRTRPGATVRDPFDFVGAAEENSKGNR